MAPTANISEIFVSWQGEGPRVGEKHLFVRFAGCNIRCNYCDTPESLVPVERLRVDLPDGSTKEFANPVGAAQLSALVEECCRLDPAVAMIAITGGEPLGQNLAPLARQLKQGGYQLHIETNGVVAPDPALFALIDHWTVSPKGYPIVEGFAHITELKYVVGKAFREDRVEEDRADHIYLQPESSEPRYVQKALEILSRHPRWRLSTRVHKTLGLP